jgi:serine/threonine protein kinase
MSDAETMEQDTSPGTVIGTVGYLSPELVRGQAVDGRSDIFSLGTLMYEMVAGEHPFRGDSPADTMSSILREDPRDLTTVNPNVTPGLDRVIRHCMEKSPEQRFQSPRRCRPADRRSRRRMAGALLAHGHTATSAGALRAAHA